MKRASGVVVREKSTSLGLVSRYKIYTKRQMYVYTTMRENENVHDN